MKIINFAIGTLILILSVGYRAEARRDNKREVRQQARIHEGVQSGEITRREAHHLRKGQRKIDHMQRKALRDGEVTTDEKAKIEAAQDRQSQQIYDQKHDDQTRSENQ